MLKGDGIIAMSGEEKPNYYLKVKLGPDFIDEYGQKDATLRKDSKYPPFYYTYEFDAVLPGSAFLRIEVWEDNLFQDEFVGSTEIDCENRYLNPHWHCFPLEKKPIESRAIRSEYGIFTGRLSLFLEIIPVKSINS